MRPVDFGENKAGTLVRGRSQTERTVGSGQNTSQSAEKYLHTDTAYPPLVRMALIHYHFEAIHPFLDGNGCVGRLLISPLLCSEGLLAKPMLYLSAYFEKHRSEYYRLLLDVSQNGQWMPGYSKR